MNKITLLLFFSVFSNVSNSKEIDCGIISEAATSITVEEFYFGHHIEVVNIPNGPTVSLWGWGEENNSSKDGFLTNYLISVGYGDIAEQPMVFRIKSRKKLGFNGEAAKLIVFNEGSLKITLMDESNGLRCSHFLLNMKQ